MENQTNPLFLPIGTVRAILILVLTALVITQEFRGLHVSAEIIGIWAGGIGLYFGLRTTGTKS